MRVGQLRSRVQVWRPVETRGVRGETVTTYARAARAWVGIQALSRALQNYGAGELAEGSMQLVAHGRAPIQPRDVLEVIAGVQAGTRWRVEGTPSTTPGEILGVVSAYNGELVEAG